MTRGTRLITFVVLFCVWSGASAEDSDDGASAQDSADGSCNGFEYGDDGVLRWDQCWPACGGDSQSPININTEDVITKSFPPLNGSFFTHRHNRLPIEYINNNHTLRLKAGKFSDRYLEGGPLNGRYILDYIEFSWGSVSNYFEGSEHAIDDKRFPLEAQWALYSEKYSNFAEASKHDGGAVMISTLFPDTDEPNENSTIDRIVSKLDDVPLATENNKKFLSYIRYGDLLLGVSPDDYYTYIGSFTKPPCSENVIWLLYLLHSGVSEEQVSKFYELQTTEGPMENNFRPMQPLNGRQVEQSDKSSRVTGESRKGSQVAKAPGSRRRGAVVSRQREAVRRPGLARRHQ